MLRVQPLAWATAPGLRGIATSVSAMGKALFAHVEEAPKGERVRALARTVRTLLSP